MTQGPYTSEFRQEFEAETARLLRNRFFWFLGTAGFAYVIIRAAVLMYHGVVYGLLSAFTSSEQVLENSMSTFRLGRFGALLVLLVTVADMLAFVGAWWKARDTNLTQKRTLNLTQWFLIYLGLTQVFVWVMMQSVGVPWTVGLYHLLACAFLPWTASQAIRPIGFLLIVNSILVLILGPESGPIRGTIIVMSILTAGPGVLIAWAKHSRRLEDFRVRALQNRYGEIRRELFDARRIHESLFPQPVLSGPLQFDYRYEPMRQIGGDYLYARFSPAEQGKAAPFNLLLLDVTGHGIAAALTVNRLYGEVERLFGEDPHAGPGRVLAALNSYVHLTLANHSVYVTALCVRVDPERGVVEYASGGHPPAFLCAANGTIEQLDSTAFVLGACSGPDFEPCVETRPFARGDKLLAYTDGALEARDHGGRMLGVAGLIRVLKGLHSDGTSGGASREDGPALCSAVLAAVERHRSGPPADDTLVVEVLHSVRLDVEIRENGHAAQASRHAISR
jgi:serine phosphatase RsbU (regulator of sigma subunit)